MTGRTWGRAIHVVAVFPRSRDGADSPVVVAVPLGEKEIDRDAVGVTVHVSDPDGV
jgi:hypothetical protein